MSAVRAALRISRRDALRAKGRTALIMTLIGLPVLVITAVLTGGATTDLTPQERLPALLGAADARIVTLPFRTAVKQDYAADGPSQRDAKRRERPWTPQEVTALLSGGRLLRYQQNSVEARVGGGFDRVDVLETDLRDPLARGMRELVEGRFAAAPGEVVVSPELAGRGVKVGGTIGVTRQERPMRVVGVARHPNRPGLAEVVALPEAVLGHQNDGNSSGWLAGTPRPVGRADVRRLNRAGLAVASRAVIESPTASELRAREGAGRRLAGVVSAGLAVVVIVAETVLLAGPAFAVGLRRRRRELALIAAQGGSAAHLRAVVLADGLVLGGLAALIGACLGAGAGVLAESLLAPALDWTHGPVDVPGWRIAGVAALGVLSGLIAALVPAVQAARQRPAQVLAGRAAVDPPGRAGRPVLGLVLVALGLAGLVAGVRPGNPWYRSAGFLGTGQPALIAATVTGLGLVAVMPWLVQLAGRLAGRLPLPMRLSVRDAARHRVRTSSAAAAVMAATMAVVALGIAVNTSFAGREADRRAVTPVGTVTVDGRQVRTDAEWSRARAVAERELPGAAPVPGLKARDRKGEAVELALAWSPSSCPDPGACRPPAYHDLDLPIGDERLLALLQGRRDAAATAALAAGKAVVFTPEAVRDGFVTLEARDPERETRATFRVPAVVASAAEPEQAGALVPASAVTAAGLQVADRALYAAYEPVDEDRLNRELNAVSGAVFTDVERPYDRDLTGYLLALLGAALVLVLGGTFAATGLAAADMRQDLDILSAVGGAPRVRRLVVAAQAACVSGLGALVGLAGGVPVGVALTSPYARSYVTGGGVLLSHGESQVHVPWVFLAVVVAGLPLLAALVTGAVTRTRWAPARRAA
ncbi:ABC transporter permease [Actinomadura sp. ATCC 31491]|uniref:ABC transporter permease n=1 Tax=Actinomadura luzonensis TaxID=2805427 RepID=A0ABT0FKA9_9ACTN|nr:ABC transporter permease [Actinomadura luzonensis]MCK2212757.1 ABC transporter permease [Actinomadura luzonensis]